MHHFINFQGHFISSLLFYISFPNRILGIYIYIEIFCRDYIIHNYLTIVQKRNESGIRILNLKLQFAVH